MLKKSSVSSRYLDNVWNKSLEMFSYSAGEQLMRSDTISSFNLLFATDTEDFFNMLYVPSYFL